MSMGAPNAQRHGERENACGHTTDWHDGRPEEEQWLSSALNEVYCSPKCAALALDLAMEQARGDASKAAQVAVEKDRKKIAEGLRMRADVAWREAATHKAAGDLYNVLSFDVEAGRAS